MGSKLRIGLRRRAIAHCVTVILAATSLLSAALILHSDQDSTEAVTRPLSPIRILDRSGHILTTFMDKIPKVLDDPRSPAKDTNLGYTTHTKRDSMQVAAGPGATEALLARPEKRE